MAEEKPVLKLNPVRTTDYKLQEIIDQYAWADQVHGLLT